MARICSLGRMGGRPRLPRLRPRRGVVIGAVALLLLLLLILNFQLYPGVVTLAISQAENQAQGLITSAFSREMQAGGEAYEELVTLHYRADGAISGMSCHMPALNAARNELLRAVLQGIAQEGVMTVQLPAGNLLGGELLSGRGPLIPIKVLLAQGARAHMASEFRSAGINQTLHRVLFSVSIALTVMTPSHPVQTTVTQTFCVAETVIVGEVPEAFTQITRLTDDISEQEIDDIYDYGAER